ncbi:MAG: hypothetical protein RLZZ584_3565 [Pseudomonadota bacterium]
MPSAGVLSCLFTPHCRPGAPLLAALALCAGAALQPALALPPQQADQPGRTAGGSARHDGVAWLTPANAAEFDAMLERARQGGQPLLLYWGASWCPPCNQLKVTLFKRADFIALSRRFVAIQLDGDAPGAQKLGARYKVRGYPTTILFDTRGQELTRLPGEVDAPLYLDALRLALNRAGAAPVTAGGTVAGTQAADDSTPARPVAALLAAARQGHPLPAAEWRRLAWYAWDTDEAALLPVDEQARVLASLGRASARVAPAASTRLLLKGVMASGEQDGTRLDDATHAAALTALQALLAAPQAAREQMDLLTGGVTDLAGRLTQAGTPARQQLLRAWSTAARRLQQDTRLSRADRLGALQARVDLAALGRLPGDAAVDDALRADIRATVTRFEAEIGSPAERQVVIPTAAHLLHTAGLRAEADALLLAHLERSPSPYYLMSMLAGNAADRGDRAAALDWSRRAWEGSTGAATRLQWGVAYLGRLISLGPDDADRIEQVAAAILAEAAATPDAYHERNARSLQRLASRLKGWAGPAGAQARLERLARALAPVCAQLPEGDTARAECAGLLASGG